MENKDKTPVKKTVQPLELVANISAKYTETPIAQQLIKEGKEDLLNHILANFYIFCRENIQDLPKMSQLSMLNALNRACQFKLVPDKINACFVSYWSNAKNCFEVQFQPMYQGLIAKAYSTGLFKNIVTGVVYENDEFDYELGAMGFVKHKKNLVEKRKIRVAAYADVLLNNGGRLVEVMTMDEINLIKESAKTQKIWDKWFDPMIRKSVAKQPFKYCPKNEDLDQLIQYDNSLEGGENLLKLEAKKKVKNINDIINGNQVTDEELEEPKALPEKTGQEAKKELSEAEKQEILKAEAGN